MWEIIKPIISLLCFLIMTFLYGIPAIFVGIMEIKDKYSSTKEGIFFVCWGTLVLILSISSFINFFFI